MWLLLASSALAGPTFSPPAGSDPAEWRAAVARSGLTLVAPGQPATAELRRSDGWTLIIHVGTEVRSIPVASPKGPSERDDITLLAASLLSPIPTEDIGWSVPASESRPPTPTPTPKLPSHPVVTPAPMAVTPPKGAVKPAASETRSGEPPAVETRPVAVETPPAAVETRPVAVQTPPVAVEARPVAVETRPVAVETPPVAVEPRPFEPAAEQDRRAAPPAWAEAPARPAPPREAVVEPPVAAPIAPAPRAVEAPEETATPVDGTAGEEVLDEPPDVERPAEPADRRPSAALGAWAELEGGVSMRPALSSAPTGAFAAGLGIEDARVGVRVALDGTRTVDGLGEPVGFSTVDLGIRVGWASPGRASLEVAGEGGLERWGFVTEAGTEAALVPIAGADVGLKIRAGRVALGPRLHATAHLADVRLGRGETSLVELSPFRLGAMLVVAVRTR